MNNGVTSEFEATGFDKLAWEEAMSKEGTIAGCTELAASTGWLGANVCKIHGRVVVGNLRWDSMWRANSARHAQQQYRDR
jgi:hypothetical protein